MEVASTRKEETYPELTGDNGRARLVVFALEVGGRWSSEGIRFIRLLAKDRAKQEPVRLRVRAALAWQRRWCNILGIAAQRAIANSLLERGRASGAVGGVPTVHELLAERLGGEE